MQTACSKIKKLELKRKAPKDWYASHASGCSLSMHTLDHVGEKPSWNMEAEWCNARGLQTVVPRQPARRDSARKALLSLSCFRKTVLSIESLHYGRIFS